MNTQEFTISLFTEDHIGIMNEITIILTRRQINIESITASESAVKGVQILTLVVRTTPEMVQKVVKQMQKIVEVLKVFVHTSDEIIYQELALYKVQTKGRCRETLIDGIVLGAHNARILEFTPSLWSIRKRPATSRKINGLLHLRLTFAALLQFVSSGQWSGAHHRQVMETELPRGDGSGQSKRPDNYDSFTECRGLLLQLESKNKLDINHNKKTYTMANKSNFGGIDFSEDVLIREDCNWQRHVEGSSAKKL
jgi:acetolactate synthase-1/3 small subunit